MVKASVLLLLALCGCRVQAAPEWQPDKPSPIFGGDEAVPHSWPWMVLILIEQGSFVTPCAGVLIRRKAVLTMAGCVPETADKIRVFVGEHDAKNDTVIDQEMEIDKVKYHPDLAYLKAELTIIYLKENPKLQGGAIAPLRRFSTPLFDQLALALPQYYPCVFAGWGATRLPEGNFGFTQILRELYTNLIDIGKCERQFPVMRNLEEKMCTSNRDGAPCGYGDFGGPLVCKVRDAWTLMGLYNGFNYVPNGCVKGPVAYTKISYYSDWINDSL